MIVRLFLRLQGFDTDRQANGRRLTKFHSGRLGRELGDECPTRKRGANLRHRPRLRKRGGSWGEIRNANPRSADCRAFVAILEPAKECDNPQRFSGPEVVRREHDTNRRGVHRCAVLKSGVEKMRAWGCHGWFVLDYSPASRIAPGQEGEITETRQEYGPTPKRA